MQNLNILLMLERNVKNCLEANRQPTAKIKCNLYHIGV